MQINGTHKLIELVQSMVNSIVTNKIAKLRTLLIKFFKGNLEERIGHKIILNYAVIKFNMYIMWYYWWLFFNKVTRMST